MSELIRRAPRPRVAVQYPEVDWFSPHGSPVPQRVVDANGRDGEWREIAWLPYVVTHVVMYTDLNRITRDDVGEPLFFDVPAWPSPDGRARVCDPS